MDILKRTNSYQPLYVYWGAQCNTYIHISTSPNSSLGLGIMSNYDGLWNFILYITLWQLEIKITDICHIDDQHTKYISTSGATKVMYSIMNIWLHYYITFFYNFTLIFDTIKETHIYTFTYTICKYNSLCMEQPRHGLWNAHD